MGSRLITWWSGPGWRRLDRAGALTGAGFWAAAGLESSSVDETLPLTGDLSLLAGESPAVACISVNGGTFTSSANASITATLISNATGSSAKLAPAKRPSLPHR